MRLKHIDLFSGIGGFSYALDTVFYGHEIEHSFVEFNEFCQAALRKHWPQAIIHGDIRTFTNTDHCRLEEPRAEQQADRDRQFSKDLQYESFISNTADTGIEKMRGRTNEVFLVTGGFPCQPFSAAGRRKGTADDRYLWPEMFRVIREFKPTWVVAENVRGLVTWNDGMVLEQVCADLESEGYEVQPLIIPAVAVNAPHRRDRVWIIAHASGTGAERECGAIADERGRTSEDRGESLRQTHGEAGPSRTAPANTNATNTNTGRLRRHERPSAGKGATSRSGWESNWLEVATRLCSVDDGLPGQMGDTTISKPRHRKEQLKAYGNAIVPQVAMRIFEAIRSTL